MIKSNTAFKVSRTLPRRGETYAVLNRRTGKTELRVAARDFHRDRRRVLIPLTTVA